MINLAADFFKAWEISSDSERLAQIAKAVSKSVTYCDPRTPSPVKGIEALNHYVGQFCINAPGWTAQIVKSDKAAETSRVTVAFSGKGQDGKTITQYGQYFIEQGQNQLISRMVGFVGTGAPD